MADTFKLDNGLDYTILSNGADATNFLKQEGILSSNPYEEQQNFYGNVASGQSFINMRSNELFKDQFSDMISRLRTTTKQEVAVSYDKQRNTITVLTYEKDKQNNTFSFPYAGQTRPTVDKSKGALLEIPLVDKKGWTAGAGKYSNKDIIQYGNKGHQDEIWKLPNMIVASVSRSLETDKGKKIGAAGSQWAFRSGIDAAQRIFNNLNKDAVEEQRQAMKLDGTTQLHEIENAIKSTEVLAGDYFQKLALAYQITGRRQKDFAGMAMRILTSANPHETASKIETSNAFRNLWGRQAPSVNRRKDLLDRLTRLNLGYDLSSLSLKNVNENTLDRASLGQFDLASVLLPRISNDIKRNQTLQRGTQYAAKNSVYKQSSIFSDEKLNQLNIKRGGKVQRGKEIPFDAFVWGYAQAEDTLGAQDTVYVDEKLMKQLGFEREFVAKIYASDINKRLNEYLKTDMSKNNGVSQEIKDLSAKAASGVVADYAQLSDNAKIEVAKMFFAQEAKDTHRSMSSFDIKGDLSKQIHIDEKGDLVINGTETLKGGIGTAVLGLGMKGPANIKYENGTHKNILDTDRYKGGHFLIGLPRLDNARKAGEVLDLMTYTLFQEFGESGQHAGEDLNQVIEALKARQSGGGDVTNPNLTKALNILQSGIMGAVISRKGNIRGYNVDFSAIRSSLRADSIEAQNLLVAIDRLINPDEANRYFKINDSGNLEYTNKDIRVASDPHGRRAQYQWDLVDTRRQYAGIIRDLNEQFKFGQIDQMDYQRRKDAVKNAMKPKKTDVQKWEAAQDEYKQALNQTTETGNSDYNINAHYSQYSGKKLIVIGTGTDTDSVHYIDPYTLKSADINGTNVTNFSETFAGQVNKYRAENEGWENADVAIGFNKNFSLGGKYGGKLAFLGNTLFDESAPRGEGWQKADALIAAIRKDGSDIARQYVADFYDEYSRDVNKEGGVYYEYGHAIQTPHSTGMVSLPINAEEWANQDTRDEVKEFYQNLASTGTAVSAEDFQDSISALTDEQLDAALKALKKANGQTLYDTLTASNRNRQGKIDLLTEAYTVQGTDLQTELARELMVANKNSYESIARMGLGRSPGQQGFTNIWANPYVSATAGEKVGSNKVMFIGKSTANQLGGDWDTDVFTAITKIEDAGLRELMESQFKMHKDRLHTFAEFDMIKNGGNQVKAVENTVAALQNAVRLGLGETAALQERQNKAQTGILGSKRANIEAHFDKLRDEGAITSDAEWLAQALFGIFSQDTISSKKVVGKLLERVKVSLGDRKAEDIPEEEFNQLVDDNWDSVTNLVDSLFAKGGPEAFKDIWNMLSNVGLVKDVTFKEGEKEITKAFLASEKPELIRNPNVNLLAHYSAALQSGDDKQIEEVETHLAKLYGDEIVDAIGKQFDISRGLSSAANKEKLVEIMERGWSMDAFASMMTDNSGRDLLQLALKSPEERQAPDVTKDAEQIGNEMDAKSAEEAGAVKSLEEVVRDIFDLLSGKTQPIRPEQQQEHRERSISATSAIKTMFPPRTFTKYENADNEDVMAAGTLGHFILETMGKTWDESLFDGEEYEKAFKDSGLSVKAADDIKKRAKKLFDYKQKEPTLKLPDGTDAKTARELVGNEIRLGSLSGYHARIDSAYMTKYVDQEGKTRWAYINSDNKFSENANTDQNRAEIAIQDYLARRERKNIFGLVDQIVGKGNWDPSNLLGSDTWTSERRGLKDEQYEKIKQKYIDKAKEEKYKGREHAGDTPTTWDDLPAEQRAAEEQKMRANFDALFKADLILGEIVGINKKGEKQRIVNVGQNVSDDILEKIMSGEGGPLTPEEKAQFKSSLVLQESVGEMYSHALSQRNKVQEQLKAYEIQMSQFAPGSKEYEAISAIREKYKKEAEQTDEDLYSHIIADVLAGEEGGGDINEDDKRVIDAHQILAKFAQAQSEEDTIKGDISKLQKLREAQSKAQIAQISAIEGSAEAESLKNTLAEFGEQIAKLTNQIKTEIGVNKKQDELTEADKERIKKFQPLFENANAVTNVGIYTSLSRLVKSLEDGIKDYDKQIDATADKDVKEALRAKRDRAIKQRKDYADMKSSLTAVSDTDVREIIDDEIISDANKEKRDNLSKQSKIDQLKKLYTMQANLGVAKLATAEHTEELDSLIISGKDIQAQIDEIKSEIGDPDELNKDLQNRLSNAEYSGRLASYRGALSRQDEIKSQIKAYEIQKAKYGDADGIIDAQISKLKSEEKKYEEIIIPGYDNLGISDEDRLLINNNKALKERAEYVNNFMSAKDDISRLQNLYIKQGNLETMKSTFEEGSEEYEEATRSLQDFEEQIKILTNLIQVSMSGLSTGDQEKLQERIKAAKQSHGTAASKTATQQYRELMSMQLSLEQEIYNYNEILKKPNGRNTEGLEDIIAAKKAQLAETQGKIKGLDKGGITADDLKDIEGKYAFGHSNIGNKQTFGGLVSDDIKKGISMNMAGLTRAGISGKMIQELIKDFKKVYTLTLQLNESMTNLRMVTGDNETQARSMMQTYNGLAKELGTTTKAVAESATEWLRQGYSAAETEELITSSTYLAKLGFMNQTQAVEALTSAMKGFNLSAQDSMSIVDKLTTLDAKYATTAGDIATAMSQTASVAKSAGLGMEETAAALTTIMDVSQAAPGTAGTALKSMLSRYGNVKAGAFSSMMGEGEDTEGINDIEKVLNNIGIKIRTSTMDMRDYDDILADVAEKYQTLSDVERGAVLTAMAGTRNRNSLEVLLQNWGTYKDALEAEKDSEGQATRKYDVYKESIAYQKEELTAAWEGLVQRIEDSELIKTGISILTALVDNFDKIFPALTTMVATITQLKPNIKNAILDGLMPNRKATNDNTKETKKNTEALEKKNKTSKKPKKNAGKTGSGTGSSEETESSFGWGSALSTAALTGLSYGSMGGGTFGNLLDQDVHGISDYETSGTNVMTGLVSAGGSLAGSAIGFAFGGPAGQAIGSAAGSIIGDIIASGIKAIILQDEKERAERVKTANAELSLLSDLNNSIEAATDLVEKDELTDASDWESLRETVLALREGLLAEDEDTGATIYTKFSGYFEDIYTDMTKETITVSDALDDLAENADNAADVIAAYTAAQLKYQAESEWRAGETERTDILEELAETKSELALKYIASEDANERNALAKQYKSKYDEDIDKQVSRVQSDQQILQGMQDTYRDTMLQSYFQSSGLANLTTADMQGETLNTLLRRFAQAAANDTSFRLHDQVYDEDGNLNDDFKAQMISLINSDETTNLVNKGSTNTISDINRLKKAHPGLYKQITSNYSYYSDLATSNSPELQNIASNNNFKDIFELIKYISDANPSTYTNIAHGLGLTMTQLEESGEKFNIISEELVGSGLDGLIEVAEKFESILVDLSTSSELSLENLEYVMNKFPALLIGEDGSISQDNVISNLSSFMQPDGGLSQLFAGQFWENYTTGDDAISAFNVFREAQKKLYGDDWIKNTFAKTEVSDEAKTALESSTAKYGDTAIKDLFIKDSDAAQTWLETVQSLIAETGLEDAAVDQLIKYQTNAYDQEIDNLQSIKDSLEDVNKLRQRELDLMKAKEELANASKEKKTVYMAGLGFVQMADQEAIKEAQEKVDELERQKTQEDIQYQIDILEQQKNFLEEIAENDEMTRIAEWVEEIAGKDGDTKTGIPALIESLSQDNLTKAIQKAIQTPSENEEARTEESWFDEGGAIAELETKKKEYEEAYEYAKSVENTPLYESALEEAQGKYSAYTDALSSAQNTVGDRYNDILSGNYSWQSGKAADGNYSAKASDAFAEDVADVSTLSDAKAYAADDYGYVDYTKTDNKAYSYFATQGGTHGTTWYKTPTSDVWKRLPEDVTKDDLTDTSVYGPGTMFMETGSGDDRIGVVTASGGIALYSSLDTVGNYLDSIYKDYSKNGGYTYLKKTVSPDGESDIYTRQARSDGADFMLWVSQKDGLWHIQDMNSLESGEVSDEFRNNQVIGFNYFDNELSISNTDFNRANTLSKDSALDYIKGRYTSHASGTTSFSGGSTLINEQGLEGIITPQGTLTSLPAKSGILPADLTKNLWSLGEVAPNLIARLSGNTLETTNNAKTEDNSISVGTLTATFNTGDDFDAEQFWSSVRSEIILTKNNH